MWFFFTVLVSKIGFCFILFVFSMTMFLLIYWYKNKKKSHVVLKHLLYFPANSVPVELMLFSKRNMTLKVKWCDNLESIKLVTSIWEVLRWCSNRGSSALWHDPVESFLQVFFSLLVFPKRIEFKVTNKCALYLVDSRL